MEAAKVGAAEAQQAEGTLYLHFFIYLQIAHQHLNVHEIGERLRDGLMSMESLMK